MPLRGLRTALSSEHSRSILSNNMYKLVVLFAVVAVAFAAPKPGLVAAPLAAAPVAYTAAAPVAYAAPAAYAAAPVAYSAYSAYPAYSAYSAYSYPYAAAVPSRLVLG